MFWGWKRRALQARTIVSDQRKTIEALRADRDNWKSIAKARADEIREQNKERQLDLQRISALADVGDELKARADKAEAELAEAQAGIIQRSESRARLLGSIARLLAQAQELVKLPTPERWDWSGTPDCCGPFAPCGPIEATITPVGTCEADQAAPQPAEAACDEEPFDVDEEPEADIEAELSAPILPRELTLPVIQAGLVLQKCSPHHFKILGGKVPVDFWPYSKRGFTVAVDGGKGMRGHTIESAIALAKGAK